MNGIRDLETYIADIKCDNKINEEITVEHRSNNPKRDYLFVNKIQGKHIPCNPKSMIEMCNMLGDKVDIAMNGKYKHVLVIGFAETATAIAHFVAKKLDHCDYIMCTTRESMDAFGEQLITFEEEHSHATTQKLYTWKDGRIDLSETDYILFVEDEISTGNTILNFIEAFQNQDKIRKDVKFGVASICNWQDEDTAKNFEKYADRYFLVSGSLKDVHAKMDITDDNIVETKPVVPNNEVKVIYKKYNTDYKYSAILGRRADEPIIPLELINDLAKTLDSPEVPKCNSVRIIGTEECMAPALILGSILYRVGYDYTLCHATTRSKIDVINDGTPRKYNEAIRSRHEIKSLYDINRKTYIYNIEKKTGITIVLTNADVKLGEHRDIIDLLSSSTEVIYFIQM